MKKDFVKTFEEMSDAYSTQSNTPGIGDIKIPADLPRSGTPVFPLSTYITKKKRKKKKTKSRRSKTLPNKELGNKYEEK